MNTSNWINKLCSLSDSGDDSDGLVATIGQVQVEPGKKGAPNNVAARMPSAPVINDHKIPRINNNNNNSNINAFWRWIESALTSEFLEIGAHFSLLSPAESQTYRFGIHRPHLASMQIIKKQEKKCKTRRVLIPSLTWACGDLWQSGVAKFLPISLI